MTERSEIPSGNIVEQLFPKTNLPRKRKLDLLKRLLKVQAVGQSGNVFNLVSKSASHLINNMTRNDACGMLGKLHLMEKRQVSDTCRPRSKRSKHRHSTSVVHDDDMMVDTVFDSSDVDIDNGPEMKIPPESVKALINAINTVYKHNYGYKVHASDDDIKNLLLFLGSRKGAGFGPNLERACDAVSTLQGLFITWPCKDERVLIAKRIYSKNGIPNCVGVMSNAVGDSSKFVTKKTCSVCIVNDDRHRIRYYQFNKASLNADGNAQHVNVPLITPSITRFSNTEYVLAGHQFDPSNTVVPRYLVTLPNASNGSDDDKDVSLPEQFNGYIHSTMMSMYKTQMLLLQTFPWLFDIHELLEQNPDNTGIIEKLLTATFVIHNFMIYNKNQQIPLNWKKDIPCQSTSSVDSTDSINKPIQEDGSDGTARDRLMRFFKKHCVPQLISADRTSVQ